IQELVGHDDGRTGCVATWTAPADELRRVVAAAGFLDVELRDATGAGAEEAAPLTTARDGLHRRLRALGGDFEALVTSREATANALRSGRLRIAQAVARRPA